MMVSTPVRPAPALRLVPMTVQDLDRVLAVEVGAYSFPWSRGNFIDSLAAGYLAELLVDVRDGALIGYYVAMAGVDELHLLNLTVAPPRQRHGHALTLLSAVEAQATGQRLGSVWLEVRASNERARALYRRWGFDEAGLRRGYYPAAGGQREDAVVMALGLPRRAGGEAADGLE